MVTRYWRNRKVSSWNIHKPPLSLFSISLISLVYPFSLWTGADGAIAMLESLSGRTHQVVTGVTIMFHPNHEIKSNQSVAASSSSSSTLPSPPIIESFHVSTSVTFDKLSAESIRFYVESGEPFDKAGGYGYQSIAATFVTGINGCYYNVVGFPLHELAKRLKPHLDRIIEKANTNSHSNTATATSQ